LAAKHGHFYIVEYLVLHGSEINLLDQRGYTPIHYAQASSNKQVIELLKRREKEIRTINEAASEGNIPLIIEMYIKGLNYDIKNNDGEYNIHICSKKGQLGIAELYVK